MSADQRASRITGLDLFAAEYRSSAAEFVRALSDSGRATLGTLGPVGTSSHHAVDHLCHRLAEFGMVAPFDVRLHPSFDLLLDELTAGQTRYALVPSAYQNATAFHWHPGVRLLFHFVHPTPAYGLAARRGVPLTGSATVSVATVPEVRSLYHSMRPADLHGRGIRWVDAGSAVGAAALLAEGVVDLALTNENGRSRYQLDWLSYRPGALIVWLLFESLAAARHPETFPERQFR